MPGTMLKNRYIVGVALGVGGFGITYKCFDTKVGGICAVKEYFPANFASRAAASRTVSVSEQNIERYNKIMKRFVEEADLVKSLNHRNIITIFDSFFENNTAYYVMEYCDGIDLRKYTNNFSRKLGYDEGLNILYQVMNGLEYIHQKGILHRDIAPDNIYITKNKTIKILDFGSARNEMDQLNKELSVIVKMGYAPIEQYGGRGKQGPYTDIYALGATFYHLFTGRIPVESTQRVAEDGLVPFSTLRPDLPDNLKYCIEKAMELTTSRRISNIAEMKSILGLGNDSVRKQRAVTPPVPPVPPVKPPTVPPVKPPVKPIQRRSTGGFFVKRADWGMRMGAYMMDLLICGLVYFSVLFGALGANEISAVLSVLFPIIFTIVNTISEMLASTTLGKVILRMYICSKNGGEVQPSQIVFRNVIKMLGVFVLIFSQDNELLQDRTTDSIVYVKE